MRLPHFAPHWALRRQSMRQSHPTARVLADVKQTAALFAWIRVHHADSAGWYVDMCISRARTERVGSSMQHRSEGLPVGLSRHASKSRKSRYFDLLTAANEARNGSFREAYPSSAYLRRGEAFS
ncbi:hypothetical protein DENSPDRAFT_412642 [Dentipellis sp. KUC8613]|nr:hypothetical protein DENSPDRAFT_412642 [Dentipellis sp. KUC8613]